MESAAGGGICTENSAPAPVGAVAEDAGGAATAAPAVTAPAVTVTGPSVRPHSADPDPAVRSYLQRDPLGGMTPR
jgi:hypothetical protein